ncbi:Calx-beta domain-containing protein [Kaarinaea lacus]
MTVSVQRGIGNFVLLLLIVVVLTACKQESNEYSALSVDPEQPALIESGHIEDSSSVEPSILDAFGVDPLVIPLLGGQYIEVGTVTVVNTEASIIVVYETTQDWMITETHLDAALDYSGLHTNRSGNPIPGRFDYSTHHPDPVHSVTYVIDDLEWSAGMDIYLATHAVVVSAQGNETAWAGNLEFPGKNWATYFTYTAQQQTVDPRGQLQFGQAIYETAELGRGRPNLVEIEVLRVGGTQGTISARYTITGGTATLDSDYTIESTSGVLEFLDGETSKVISIIIYDDNEYEQYELAYETIDLVLEESCCLGDQQNTQVHIFDDEELN